MWQNLTRIFQPPATPGGSPEPGRVTLPSQVGDYFQGWTMPEMTVRPELLDGAGDECDRNVAAPLSQAVTAFADAPSAPAAAGMDVLTCAPAAYACLEGWHEPFRDAAEVMHTLGDKLRATSNAVRATDLDAADLYSGVRPELPTISIDIGA